MTLGGVLLALLVDTVASSHVEHAHYTAVDTEEKEGGGGSLSIELVSGGGGGGGGEADRVEELMRLKQKLVSQVLEIGIIFHSVIIGVTMGMSQNVCTIRPLVAALAFHQIFEGLGLGGCIAQVNHLHSLLVFLFLNSIICGDMKWVWIESSVTMKILIIFNVGIHVNLSSGKSIDDS